MISDAPYLSSFSELMPILLNILIGVPQMLSNIQYVLGYDRTLEYRSPSVSDQDDFDLRRSACSHRLV